MRWLIIVLLNFPTYSFAAEKWTMHDCLQALGNHDQSQLKDHVIELGKDKLAFIDGNKVTIYTPTGSVTLDGLGCSGSDRKNTLGNLFASKLVPKGNALKKLTDDSKTKPFKDRAQLDEVFIQPYIIALNICSQYSEVMNLRSKILPSIKILDSKQPDQTIQSGVNSLTR